MSLLMFLDDNNYNIYIYIYIKSQVRLVHKRKIFTINTRNLVAITRGVCYNMDKCLQGGNAYDNQLQETLGDAGTK